MFGEEEVIWETAPWLCYIQDLDAVKLAQQMERFLIPSAHPSAEEPKEIVFHKGRPSFDGD